MKLLKLLFGGVDLPPSEAISVQHRDECVHAWTLHQRHYYHYGRPLLWC